jgi:hypothetical protein
LGKDVFEALLTSAPLNATAGRVTARGEHWEPEDPLPPGLLHWKSPPPTRAWVPYPGGATSDLTGKTFGRFTVVGLLEKRPEQRSKNSGDRWVCRCSCGDFEVRSTNAIRAALGKLVSTDLGGYRCWYCAKWQSIQGQYKKKGSRPISDFTNGSIAKPKVVSPDLIIAKKIESITDDPGGGYEYAVNIIKALNRAGYRIIRETIPSQSQER